MGGLIVVVIVIVIIVMVNKRKKAANRCPKYGECTVDANLLEVYDMEDTISDWSKFRRVMCEGQGNPKRQWENCIRMMSSDERIRYAAGERRNYPSAE